MLYGSVRAEEQKYILFYNAVSMDRRKSCNDMGVCLHDYMELRPTINDMGVCLHDYMELRPTINDMGVCLHDYMELRPTINDNVNGNNSIWF